MPAEKSVAALTIKRPGEMTPRGREQLAAWLRAQAKNLVKHGDAYTTNTFRARYLYIVKE